MGERERVSIKGLDKDVVLAALYNASRPMGMGVLRAKLGNMTVEEAHVIRHDIGDDHSSDFPGTCHNKERGYFDYVHGRPLKVDLSRDEFDPWGFDRDNGGPGTAAKIIEGLRRAR